MKTWTDERVEYLKSRWANNASASMIARELGDVTREAVIGKVERLGLPAHVVKPPRLARSHYQRTEWPDGIVETMKRMWGDGATASAIGAAVGKTRSAVLGKIHRLADAGEMAGYAARPQRSNVPKAPSQPRKPRTTSAFVLHRIATRDEKAPPPKPSPRPDLPEPTPLSLTLMDLTGATCKYPLGAFEEPALLFCGNATFGSGVYCEFHTRLCYQPAKKGTNRQATAWTPERRDVARAAARKRLSTGGAWY